MYIENGWSLNYVVKSAFWFFDIAENWNKRKK
jgi:hypothetical protein